MITPTTLVLDIDETLVHTWQDPTFVNQYNIYTKRFKEFCPPGQDPKCYSISEIDLEFELWGLYRPHYREFISFVTNYFDNIIVWSAGTDYYVREMTKRLFDPSFSSKYPNMICSRDECVKDRKGNYHKPLKSILKRIELERLPMEIDLDRTMIIDDKQHTFRDNPGYGVHIPAYDFENEPKPNGLHQDDDHLLKFIEWVKRIDLKNKATFGPSLDKSNIFL